MLSTWQRCTPHGQCDTSIRRSFNTVSQGNCKYQFWLFLLTVASSGKWSTPYCDYDIRRSSTALSYHTRWAQQCGEFSRKRITRLIFASRPSPCVAGQLWILRKAGEAERTKLGINHCYFHAVQPLHLNHQVLLLCSTRRIAWEN